MMILASLIISSSWTLSGCSEAHKTVDKSRIQVSTTSSSASAEDNTVTGGTSTSEEPVSPYDIIADSRYPSAMHKHADIVDHLYNGDNLIYSPMSLDMVMGMAANGADNISDDAYVDFFCMHRNDFNTHSKVAVTSASEEVEIANKIFIHNSHQINEDTNNILIDYYNSSAATLDFTAPDSADIVNEWCNQSTHGMIPSIVHDISSYEMLLANALYFKDSWEEEITDNMVNEQGQFTLFDGVVIDNIAMMCASADGYLENEHATGFVKNYSNSRYGFVGILPNDTGEFDLSSLDVKNLLSTYDSDNYVVDIEMPEFTFDSTMNLYNVLSELGYDDILKASYSKLVTDDVLSISTILQKAKIDVNREGTEAAAVSVIMMDATAVISEDMPEYKTVRLDRPFAFMIYDFANDDILFMGKVVNPSTLNSDDSDSDEDGVTDVQ